jgi:SpoVK/Ycf46/Vps4 family AAA+-type ATPase
VSLRYSELDAAARRQIWTQFVGQHSGFTEDQLDDIATERLNGREIKNVIKTAHLLALAQESELKYEHVDAVLSLRAFNPV